MLKLSPNMRTCPYCGEKNSFQPYKFEGARIIINPKVGKCSKCHKQYSYHEYLSKKLHLLAAFSKSKEAQIILDVGKQELGLEDPNVFYSKYFSSGDIEDDKLFQYIVRLLANKQDSLSNVISKERIQKTFELYGLQTSTLWFREDATIFWYMTSYEKRLSYRIMKFKEDGHSIKEKDKEYPITKSLVIGEDGKGKYCLFGRHLIGREDSYDKPVCIVESEKSAIIASLVYPNAIWLATGSCYFLKGVKIKCDYIDDSNTQIGQTIDPQRVILFPDPDLKFEDKHNWYYFPWYNTFKGVRVCNYLDIFIRTHKEEFIVEEEVPSGFDIADYIEWQIRHNQNFLPLEDMIRYTEQSDMSDFGICNRQIKASKICSDLYYILSVTGGKLVASKELNYFWNFRVLFNKYLNKIWQIYSLENTDKNGYIQFRHSNGKNGFDVFSEVKCKKHIVEKTDIYKSDSEEYVFFGEHLLKSHFSENKLIALVESEITAIICASLFPSVIWIASGNMSSMIMNFGEQLVLDRIRDFLSKYQGRIVIFNSPFFASLPPDRLNYQFLDLIHKISGEEKSNPHLILNNGRAHSYIDDYSSKLVMLDVNDIGEYLRGISSLLENFGLIAEPDILHNLSL